MRRRQAILVALGALACAALASTVQAYSLKDQIALKVEALHARAEAGAKEAATAAAANAEAVAAAPLGSKKDAIRAAFEAHLAAKQNPPMVFVPGLFGSYLSATASSAACDAIPVCVELRRPYPFGDPDFVAALEAGPVLINDFFAISRTNVDVDYLLPKRVDLLVALLTQTYTGGELQYAPGVAIAVNGTGMDAHCEGVSATYRNGIIDKYFVGQLGYEIGTTLACSPYNWELDMPGLDQAGYFAQFAERVSEVYNNPANDPPLPNMPRKKVLVVGHSMGTLFATSAVLDNPALAEMVETIILISPVAAGTSLASQGTLYGGYEPALSFGTVLPDFSDASIYGIQLDGLNRLIWSLGQIAATNPTLAPYTLPPYNWTRLTPPEFPDGFPPDQEVALAFNASSRDDRLAVTITAGDQYQALFGPLFKQEDGNELLTFLQQIWPRSHSYNETVVAWSTGGGPSGVKVFCAYGDGLDSILTAAASVPFPFPNNVTAGFTQIKKENKKQAYGLGDAVVNKQGSNGCDRMADYTGGEVFTSLSKDCEHIRIIEAGPGANALMDQVFAAAGVNIHPARLLT